eukprot:2790365-Amphidinium_carterae.1
MAVVLGSLAFFQAQALQMGGWKTFAAYVSSTQFVPGQLDELALRRPLRRLFYEAFTAIAGDLEQRTERIGDDVPKKFRWRSALLELELLPLGFLVFAWTDTTMTGQRWANGRLETPKTKRFVKLGEGIHTILNLIDRDRAGGISPCCFLITSMLRPRKRILSARKSLPN